MYPNRVCAGVDSVPLLYRSKTHHNDSVRFKWTVRKSKMKEKSWNVDPNDRGFHSKLNKDA